MCSASLVTLPNRAIESRSTPISRPESPGPSLPSTPVQDPAASAEIIKLSFRTGGDKVFYERMKGALIQRKWLLTNAPPVPNQHSQTQASQLQSSYTANGTPTSAAPQPQPRKQIGIAGLERRGQDLRKNNEFVIGTAFEDLEALMTSAKEVIAMADRFSSSNANNPNSNNSAEASALLSESASALGLVTTRDMLGSGGETLYLTELARNLAEFLTDDTKGVLRREGGIMSLVDLWAVFNRTRNGIELISPLDFEKAAAMWEKLGLPIRLRRFRSGLLVVQGRDRTDEKTVAAILGWLESFKSIPPDLYSDLSTPTPSFGTGTTAMSHDWQTLGQGITASDAARHFGWSIGVASEELEMAEDRGALCREVGVDGVRFWENWFAKWEVEMPRARTPDQERFSREVIGNLRTLGL